MKVRRSGFDMDRGLSREKHNAKTIGIRPEHLTISTNPDADAWQGTVGVAEHLGSDTFVHVHGIEGCDPLTVRTGGDFNVKYGDTVYLKPDLDHLHKFDADGLRMA